MSSKKNTKIPKHEGIELKEMKLSDHKSLKKDTSSKVVKNIKSSKAEKVVETEKCHIISLDMNEFVSMRRNFFLESFPVGEIHND